MQYSVRHVTRFKYVGPVRESVMEVRLQPRTDVRQTCYSFQLDVDPTTQVSSYKDHAGNVVHHFDIASKHETLKLESRAVVQVTDPVTLSGDSSSGCTWDELDRAVEQGDFWDYLHPSKFARPTESLVHLAAEFNLVRRDAPLPILCEMRSRFFTEFEYQPLSTHANSPIDDALRDRAGVCQDFAHIFIALARRLGIPSRYVSGYLYHRMEDHDRSADDSSHAWVESYLPGIGWVGLDPTNDIVAEDRHIVVAVGRDYADVPPTKGVFKGVGSSELQVGVRVTPMRTDDQPPAELKLATMPQKLTEAEAAAIEEYQQQQQQ